MIRATILLCFLVVSLSGAADETAERWQALLAAEHRTPAYVERDVYRHPQQTLEFFGLTPTSTVVEIWPGGGWYSEILAPLLREQGQFYAAHFPADSEIKYFVQSRARFEEKLAALPAVYDRVTITSLMPPEYVEIAPAGTADLVLTFRNVHNWMKAGNEQQVLAAIFASLKPNGVLGVVEHRAKPGTDEGTMIRSGYVTEEHVIAMAKAAGFILLARSEINANPSDTADHPKGVWTLPPSLRLGEEDRDKYLAIGESDRMTLKFVKPGE